MYDLNVIDNFYAIGRGNMFVVKSPIQCDRFTTKQSLGGVVKINEKLYDVIGVEVDMKPGLLEIGEEIGVVVKPHTHDKSVNIDLTNLEEVKVDTKISPA